jgi:hypothetical protein
MDVFCGIDWAEDHHDIAVVDASEHFCWRGGGSATTRPAGALTGVLAEHGDSAEDPIPVAIETPRGLLTACLRCRAQGLPDQPDGRGPLPGPVLGRGPEVRSVDAVVLANILRTDAHAHRPLLADSELAQAIAVLTRAQQDAVWTCIAAHNKLRSHLREYYPRVPCRLRCCQRRDHPARSPGHPGRLPGRSRRSADHQPATSTAQTRRAQAWSGHLEDEVCTREHVADAEEWVPEKECIPHVVAGLDAIRDLDGEV